MLSWLARELEQPPVDLPPQNLQASPERLAGLLRRRLGITADEQQSWGNEFHASREWRAAVQRLGIFVFHLSLGNEGCRGYSLWDDYSPLVTINHGFKSQRAWNALSRGGALLTVVVRVVERSKTHPRMPNGAWCEQFAAALLLPWKRS